MESYIFQTVTWWIFVASLLASSGLQSPGATRPTERHDEGRLHGETQGLVLLHCPRASSLWDQPDLGVQSGQAEEHRHPHAGHRQVASCSLIFEQTRRCHPLTRCFPTRMKYALFHPFIYFFFSWDSQEHVYFWQSPDQRRDCLLWPHTRRQTLCYEVLQHTSFPRLQLCGVKLWTILKFILTDFSTVGHVLRLNKLQPTQNFVLISFQLYNYMCCCLLLNVSDMGCFNLVFMFSIKCPQKFFWVLPRLATVVLLNFLQWFPDIFQDKYGQMFKWMYFYGWLRPDAACTVLGK